MTLLSLAAKNVRHNARSYGAFFLSSSFAVWLFFSYALLRTAGTLPETFRIALQFVQVVVALFSVLFILYSHTAFLKVRQKELGLLTLLGLKPGQIARMVHFENLLIGLAAITTGVSVGSLTAKLMFLLVGRVLALPEPMALHLAWQPVGLTYLLFLVMFAVISLLGRLTLRRLSLAELFRAGVKPKSQRRFSWWLVLLCALLIGGAYWIAFTADQSSLNSLIWPMLLMGLVGTYLLFAQGSVALLKLLRERRPLYWRRTNLVTLSQMVYKVKENVLILFMVTVLSTLVLVFFGIGYGAWMGAAEQAEQLAAVDIQLIGEPQGVGPARVDDLLEQHGLKVVSKASLPVLRTGVHQAFAENQFMWEPGAGIVPVSALNDWRVQLVGLEPLTVPAGKALILPRWQGEELHQETVRIGFGESAPHPVEWTPDLILPVEISTEYERLLNPRSILGRLLVVDDALFADLQRRYGDKYGETLHGWKLADWKASGALLSDLLAQVGHDEITPDGRRFDRLSGTALWHLDILANAAEMLFLFGFLGLLFFLAAGNMIYFKLFTDLTAERRQYQALQKVGLRVSEVTRIVSAQTMVLFFAPLAVGAIHAGVFVQILGRMEGISMWAPVLSVAGIYTLLQTGYFLVARRTYVRAVTSSPS